MLRGRCKAGLVVDGRVKLLFTKGQRLCCVLTFGIYLLYNERRWELAFPLKAYCILLVMRMYRRAIVQKTLTRFG
jgi:hypothetical protein